MRSSKSRSKAFSVAALYGLALLATPALAQETPQAPQSPDEPVLDSCWRIEVTCSRSTGQCTISKPEPIDCE